MQTSFVVQSISKCGTNSCSSFDKTNEVKNCSNNGKKGSNFYSLVHLSRFSPAPRAVMCIRNSTRFDSQPCGMYRRCKVFLLLSVSSSTFTPLKCNDDGVGASDSLHTLIHHEVEQTSRHRRCCDCTIHNPHRAEMIFARTFGSANTSCWVIVPCDGMPPLHLIMSFNFMLKLVLLPFWVLRARFCFNFPRVQ